MRLDKYLADMGMGTRSELKKAIKAGRACVDGTVIRDPGFRVCDSSAVEFNGEAVVYEEYVYYMLNKPAGVISASEDPHEETVVDLIDENRRRGLFPAGRLDRDTEGLMLITNDGELAHRLLSPRHHVDKKYYTLIQGELTAADIQSFADGVTLPDGLKCMPADIEIPDDISGELSSSDMGSAISSDGMTGVYITIREGKFHQIKRMFGSVGCEVVYLKRLTMGPLSLDRTLRPGEYRRLTEEEIQELKCPEGQTV